MSNVQVVLSELLIEYGMKCASIYSIFFVPVEYDYLPSIKYIITNKFL